eukprot:scaffold149527_cov30-Tisochrysis_lutea.AAC.4
MSDDMPGEPRASRLGPHIAVTEVATSHTESHGKARPSPLTHALDARPKVSALYRAERRAHRKPKTNG